MVTFTGLPHKSKNELSEEEESPIDLSEISDDESYNKDIPIDSNSDSEWMNGKFRWTYFVRRLLDCKKEEFQIQPKWHWLKRKLR